MLTRFLPLLLAFDAPAILTEAGGDPNSAGTRCFVSGSGLRGALAERMLRSGVDGNDPDFRELILSGRVHYLNAYPKIGSTRSFPVPCTMVRDKDEKSMYDLSAFHAADDAWPACRVVPWGAPNRFATLDTARITFVDVRTGGRIHNARDREKGRAWTERGKNGEVPHGTIFFNEFVEAKQTFEGMLLVRGCTEDELDDIECRIKTALPDKETVFFGRSRRAGYGGNAGIRWGTSRSSESVGVDVRNERGDIEFFRVVLSSCALGRHPETGQLDPVGVELSLRARFDGKANLVAKWQATERVGGFNRKWGTEVPQALGVAAGSVFLFRARRDLTRAELDASVAEGIGERQIEGFGRFILLPAATQHVSVERAMAAGAQHREIPGTTPVPEIVRQMERRILEAELSKRIAITVARIAATATDIPSGSLLGKLGAVLRQHARGEDALTTLAAWIGDDATLSLASPALKALTRCRIRPNGDFEPLREWLQRTLQERDEDLWMLLRFERFVQKCRIAEERDDKTVQETQRRLRAKFVAELLAALALKRRREGEGRHD